MQPIPRLKPRQEPFRIGRIANCSIKIEYAIKCSAGADPIIDRLAHHLAVRSEVVSSLAWCQRGSKDPDVMLMGTIDDLPQACDQVGGTYALRRKWTIFELRSIAGRSRFHVRPPDIVDTLEHNKIGDSRLRQDISIKTSEGIDPGAVMQNSIPTDALVEDCHALRPASR